MESHDLTIQVKVKQNKSEGVPLMMVSLIAAVKVDAQRCS